MSFINGQHIIIEDMQQATPVEVVVGECLRSVPDRRAVYQGRRGAENAIIKVFLSRFRGWYHYWREYRRLKRLEEREIERKVKNLG